MVLVTFASRRLFALSGHSNIAGQVPALPRRAAETIQYVSQRGFSTWNQFTTLSASLPLTYPLQALSHCSLPSIEINSTSKMRVALGPISAPAPFWP
jgi:hypothetical protein